MKQTFVEKYTFYRKYHIHPANKFAHCVCVPWIVWSMFVVQDNFYTLPIFVNLPSTPEFLHLKCVLSFKPSLICYTLFMSYYIFLHTYLGIMSACFYFMIFLASGAFACNVAHTWFYAIIFIISGWMIQSITHSFTQCNKPPFARYMTYGSLTAPMFAVAELCACMGCGIKPIRQPLLRESIVEQIQESTIDVGEPVFNLRI